MTEPTHARSAPGEGALEPAASQGKALLEQLVALDRRDRETRARLLEEGRLHGGYESEMQTVHRENASALAALVDRQGWPGTGQVGPEGARLAWIVAQHSICTPDLQRRFLRALAGAVDAGEAPAEYAARLEDRIRFHEGRPQRYGTVFDWTWDAARSEWCLGSEIEDPASLDARRAAVGLPPWEENLREIRASAAEEGAEPPDDMEAYRRRTEAWAKEVGWR